MADTNNQNPNQNSYINNIYQGNINLHFGESGHVSTEIMQAVGNYAVHGTQTNENAAYDTNQRIRKTAAVMSIVMSDSTQHQEANIYSDLIHGRSNQAGSTSASISMLQQQGLLGSSQANMQLNTMLKNAAFVDANGRKISSYNQMTNGLSESQLSALSKTGTLQTNINGINCQLVVPSTPTNLQKVATQALQEKQALHRLTSAHTSAEQASAIREIRHNAINNIKNQNFAKGNELASFDGSKKSFEHIMHDKSISNSAKNALIQHKNQFGLTDREGGNRNLRNQKSYGKKTVMRYMTGNEFASGMQFYQSIGKLGTAAAHIGTQTAFATTQGLLKITGQRNAASKVSNLEAKYKRNRNLRQTKEGRKNLRRERKEQRNVRVASTKETRELRYQTKQTKRINSASGVQKQKLIERRNKHNQRIINRSNKAQNSWVVKTRDRFHNISENMKSVVDRFNNSIVGKFLHTPNIIFTDFSKFKNKFIKIIIMILGGTIFVFAFINIMGAIIGGICAFFSSDPLKNSINGYLANINYAQVIVNNTALELQTEYLKVAENDAYNHFMGNSANDTHEFITSDYINWTANVKDASYGTFTDEYENVTDNISNLMQITSIMHYRMTDCLNFKQYYTAQAYEFYMWMATHHEGSVNGTYPTYDYEYDHTKCDQSLIDSGECTNIYYHGYDSSKSQAYNIARSKFREALSYLVDDSISMSVQESINLPAIDTVYINSNDQKQYGVMLQDCGKTVEIGGGPHKTTIEICHHDGGNHYHTYPCDNYEVRASDEPTCGYEVHEHTSSCFSSELTCQVPASTGHAHSQALGCYYNKTTCGKESHVHQPWNGLQDPGCYDSIYTCLGHCGGHITPIINLWYELDWENIVGYDDMLVRPKWLTESDFRVTTGDKFTNWSTFFNGVEYSLANWRTVWTSKAAQWFRPMPNMTQFCSNLGRTFINWYAEPTSQYDVPDKDAFSFKGWYDTNTGKINEKIMKDLNDLYGSRENEWENGVELWEEFGVVFPSGAGMPLTEAQRTAILEALETIYGPLSAHRSAALDSAMKLCGQFIYSLTNPQEGNATKGLIDCSGFVCSALYHADIGWTEIYWTASGFGSAGRNWDHNLDALRPGDILAKNATSSYNGSWTGGGTNHVIIFLGHFEHGIPGVAGCETPGDYIIDCSSSSGGSMIRSINDAGGASSYSRIFTSY